VATRREGNSIFYRRWQPTPDHPWRALQGVLFEAIDTENLGMEVCDRIAEVQAERAASSADFFRRHADCFEQQQERIATYSLYGSLVRELLHSTPLPGTGCALEVGSGNGEFLAELSPLFRHVVALDNSSEMLRRAQQFAAERGLDNIEFRHSDTARASSQGLSADCIVLNMVLHHTPAPADILEDACRLAADGGVLLVTELCRHHQDWAREACGDLWLGFEADELVDWARQAGFHLQHSAYHALRNGFQIQIHSFVKPLKSLSH
jgi:ArsR family transcriptional regulator